ncbi:SecA DEAD domain protein [Magnetococcus marinus MC-1]|uniref:Protein translocase subunit SecA 2 n=1 Tax=Magnetococcus marinus (strain ATCC BAA-1437 / JCM 17883 / MC-1) TaxID=156889 RepID=SECA2_MAGMM|nr:preprotein translocase subunit SecA [Magnetococcus marinus]A0L9Q5.1 RecName: Full=Protein translocase subunit SecA 2 [Magnetococcus marinus MC-1]ABK44698.1 SecA DEAD domain protein [Magnetococcus marinus MC-1]
MSGVSELLLPSPVPQGVEGVLHGLHGRWRGRAAHRRRLMQLAEQAERRCMALLGLPETQLQQQLLEIQSRFRRRLLTDDETLLAGVALVGELAWRAVQKRPYRVQFMGALAMHRGWLAEMATGEGKTLTVAVAAVLAGWSGRACHVISANDYLTERDAQQMTPLYEACGVTVASGGGALSPEERQLCYKADVVYVTAKTLLADYLRDQLATRQGAGRAQQGFAQWLTGGAQQPSAMMLGRGLHTVIIDEADSVLIDEAVTPLILAAPQKIPGMHGAVMWAAEVAERLHEEEDYTADRRTRQIQLLEGANQLMAAMAWRLDAVWRSEVRRQELVRHALSVRHFIRVGQHYLVQEDKVVLLDDATGRMTPERSLTAGLHQAIEAYEGVPLTDPNASMGQMSFQTFFRRFHRFCGTTGTARESTRELWRIYRLAVLPIPTHRPRQTVVHPTRVYATLEDKWQAVAAEVAQVHASGRPVLVGVRSVSSSEQLAAVLVEKGLSAQVLNARNHAEEAAIVSRAGQSGHVTIATNMAGRGTDIGLEEQTRSLGGLHVIIAECNSSARIDRQLAGRCGRQGDPGSVVTLLCLEEDVLRQQLSPALLGIARSLPRWGWAAGVLAGLVHYAQRRSEAQAYGQRRAVMQGDEWLNNALPF